MKKIFSALILSLLASFSLGASDLCIVGPMSYEYQVKKNDQLECVIKVANNSKQAKEVQFVLFDYPITENDSTFYPEAGSDPRSNSSWIQLPVKKVAISANSIYEYKFKINVPKNESLDGTYNSILMVEPVLSDIKLENENKAGVRSVLRYAIHLVTNIENTGSYSLKVVDKKLIQKEDKTFYMLTVENTGSMRFRPNIQADFFNEKGEKKEEIQISPMWLFPSKQRSYLFDVTSFTKGKYHGLIAFDQKGADFFGCKCSFTIGEN